MTQFFKLKATGGNSIVKDRVSMALFSVLASVCVSDGELGWRKDQGGNRKDTLRGTGRRVEWGLGVGGGRRGGRWREPLGTNERERENE